MLRLFPFFPFMFIFFFKQKTAYEMRISDWSSDVCSSDLEHGYQGEAELVRMLEADGDALVSLVAEAGGAIAGHVLFSRMDVEADGAPLPAAGLAPVSVVPERSDERRVGKECVSTGRSRW